MAKNTAPEPAQKGVLEQHAERMADDPAYREAALTPPGNHPPGGHVDEPQKAVDPDGVSRAADGSES